MGRITCVSCLLLLLFIIKQIIAIDPNIEEKKQIIQDIERNDLCKCIQISQVFGDMQPKRRALNDCKEALSAFKALPDTWQLAVCPRARRQECRHDPKKSHFSQWVCTFICNLTPEEKTRFYFRTLQPPLTWRKTLRDILNGIARHQELIEWMERRNNRFPEISEANLPVN